MVALDPETGELRWERDLIAEDKEGDARISASAAIRAGASTSR